MFKQFFAGLVACFALIFGFAGPANGQKGAAPLSDAPLLYVTDEQTGNTLIYEAKSVQPFDACPGMSLYGCHASPAGTVFYTYQTVHDRLPDADGFRYWLEQNRSANNLVRIHLDSAEAQSLMSANDYSFACRLLVNAWGGFIFDDGMCVSASWQIDQAIAALADELHFGLKTRQQAVFDVMRFSKVAGSSSLDFNDYVSNLARGYDVGQLGPLVGVLAPPPLPPVDFCDPDGYTEDPADDCILTPDPVGF